MSPIVPACIVALLLPGYAAIQSETAITEAQFLEWEAQLSQVSNRTFSSGGLETLTNNTGIQYQFEKYEKSVDYLGTIKDLTKNTTPPLMVVAVKNTFKLGDKIEFQIFIITALCVSKFSRNYISFSIIFSRLYTKSN